MLKFTVALVFFAWVWGTAGAQNRYFNQLSYNFGMANVSVTENEAGIESTDDTVVVEDEDSAGSSAVSSMAFQLTYEFANDPELRYFIKATAPLMAGNSTGVFSGDFGFNYYLSDISTKYSYSLNGNQVIINPSFRYYVGAGFGIGYLAYSTESAVKSDVFFNLGFHGGGVYAIGDSWGIKAEVGAGRTTGVATTGIKIEFFVGATYYL